MWNSDGMTIGKMHPTFYQPCKDEKPHIRLHHHHRQDREHLCLQWGYLTRPDRSIYNLLKCKLGFGLVFNKITRSITLTRVTRTATLQSVHCAKEFFLFVSVARRILQVDGWVTVIVASWLKVSADNFNVRIGCTCTDMIAIKFWVIKLILF